MVFFAAGVFYLLWTFFTIFLQGKDKIQDFTSKYVLITGCGSGFGLEIVKGLDQLGFRVIATCRTKSGEARVRQVCSEKVKTCVMDVTDSQNVQDVFEEIKLEAGEKGKHMNNDRLITLSPRTTVKECMKVYNSKAYLASGRMLFQTNESSLKS